MTTYFKIPFDDKDVAKAMGARYSGDAECWYAPDAAVEAALAARWQRTTPLVPLGAFPGEDLTFGNSPKLALDLIPSTCWFTNVRSCVSQDDWKRIAMGVKRRANKRCECCGGVADPANKVFLEPHERFDYRDGVQALRRLVCACSRCHLSLHFGHARATGREDEAREWLAQVNGWDKAQVDAAIDAAFAQWAERSRQDWTLDLSIIEGAGVVVRLPTRAQRAEKGVNLNEVHPRAQSGEDFMRSLGLL